ncbi:MAG: hypothetical protein Q7U91_11945 [Sideroxyarcus sp.]|nr:hypothetical protein [Sideroxyarcus sp.]
MTAKILLAIFFLTAASAASAAWDAGAGLEDYRWVEYPEGIDGTPKEYGPRSALFVNWTQDGERGLLYAWRAKLYAGKVDYDTFLLAAPHTPVSTQTEYSGAASEAQLLYRSNVGSYKLDQIGGLGLDVWRRAILNSGGSQIEDFSILFLRAGLRLAKPGKQAGLHAELGIKYPVSTNEDAHLTSLGYTTNPAISPGRAASGYAEIGYRINPRFDVLGYYDSWRFKRSEDVRANKPGDLPGTYWLIHQPESKMDAVGIKLLVSF